VIDSLHIENIALIERLDLQLTCGMNVLTGETGAGKSIIIDSVNLILGARASREIIRAEKRSAFVSVLFCDITPSVAQKLLKYGFFPDEDGQLLLEREITIDGRNICKLNARPVPMSALRDIGPMLVNIHGQHEASELMRVEKQLELLDQYAAIGSLLEQYRETYRIYNELIKEIETLNTDEKEKQRQTQYLSLCIDEIQEANLTHGEDEELSAKKKKFSGAKHVNAALDAACDALYQGADVDFSARDLVYTAKSALLGIANTDEMMNRYTERLENVYYELEDIALSLKDYKESFSFSEDDIDQIIVRLDTITKLKRKYGDTIEDILTYEAQCQEKLDKIIFSNQHREKLQKKLDHTQGELKKMAQKITTERANAALRLEHRMTAQLEFLDMAKVRFKVQMNTREDVKNYHSSGADAIEFLISPNLGEELKPLSKIASGGELSRIMLAMVNALFDSNSAGALIFDEIDAGVSGRAAGKVAEKLYEISRFKQVLCVTHLAQIAAMADSHYLIEKHTAGNRTQTIVSQLGPPQVRKEIARIISGVNITELTLKNADEMIQLANRKKREEKNNECI
jgi:DNA repair protein RecN (Recombination protein N)